MLTAEGPRLLEYNARLGDPETEVLLPALDSDLYRAVLDCLDGKLDQSDWRYAPGFFVDVVVAAPGYPKQPVKNSPVSLAADLLNKEEQPRLFFAGLRRDAEGQFYTDGGRVLHVLGQGGSLDEALAQAYERCAQIRFEGMQFRRDIGRRNSKR